MELDRISKHIITKMDQMDEATASELRDALGLEQNQSIHYRMDEKLIPNGYVYENPQRREQPGSRKAARVYEIEPKGREWVSSHGHEITLTDIDEAEQEIQRLSAEIRDISSDVHSLKGWKQTQSGQTGGISNSVGKLRDRVDDLDERVEKHDRRDYSEIWDRLHDLDEHTDRLSRELTELASATDHIEQVQRDIRTINNRLESLETNLNDVEATQSELVDWSNSADARLNKVEGHASQGFLGRLRWLLFG